MNRLLITLRLWLHSPDRPMTPALRWAYRIALCVCVIDMAIIAEAIHTYPDSWFAPASMGACIAIAAGCTNRLMKARKGGVRA